jgi:protocatechuate 3,4-dioxygenase beta subunit
MIMSWTNTTAGLRMTYRRCLGGALTLMGGAGLAVFVGCGDDDDTTAGATSPQTTDAAEATSTQTTDAAATDDECEEIPQETAGPYPGDGSNGPNALSESGIVRSDITSSFGDADGTAEGVPLTIKFTVQNVGDACAPAPGAAVYAWHCDSDGGYSMYSDGITDQNYLRGVQETDGSGTVTFTSIFPGCMPGVGRTYTSRCTPASITPHPALSRSKLHSSRLLKQPATRCTRRTDMPAARKTSRGSRWNRQRLRRWVRT